MYIYKFQKTIVFYQSKIGPLLMFDISYKAYEPIFDYNFIKTTSDL